MRFRDIERECEQRGLNTQLAYSLWQFYKTKNPSKLGAIPEIIEEWDGAEEDLMDALYSKYNGRQREREREKERELLSDIIKGEVNGRGYGDAKVDRVAAEVEGRESGEAVVEQIKRNAKKRVAEKITSGSPLMLPDALDERLPPSPPPPLGAHPSPIRGPGPAQPLSPPPAQHIQQTKPPQLGSQPIAAVPRPVYHATTPRGSKPRKPPPTPIPSVQSSIPTPTPTPMAYHPAHMGGVPTAPPHPVTDLDRSIQELEEACDTLQGRKPPQYQYHQHHMMHTLDGIEKFVTNLERPRYQNLPITVTGPQYHAPGSVGGMQSGGFVPQGQHSAEGRYLALRAELEQYQKKVQEMLGGRGQLNNNAQVPHSVPPVPTPVVHASAELLSSVPVPIPAVSEPDVRTQSYAPSAPKAPVAGASFRSRGDVRVWWVTHNGLSPLPDFRCTFYTNKVYIVETAYNGREEVWLWIGRNANQNDSNAGFSEACKRSDAKGPATPLHRVFSEAEGRYFASVFPFSLVLSRPLSAGVHVLQVNTVGDNAVQLCEAPECTEATDDGVPCLIVHDGGVSLVCGDELKRDFCEAVLGEFAKIFNMTQCSPQLQVLQNGTPSQRQLLDARLVARLGLSLKSPSRMVRVTHIAQNSYSFNEVPFEIGSLHPSCVFLIFHQRAVTVWAGAAIPLGVLARGVHISTVDTYIAENNLPPDMPISLVIQGHEPPLFEDLFMLSH